MIEDNSISKISLVLEIKLFSCIGFFQWATQNDDEVEEKYHRNDNEKTKPIQIFRFHGILR